MSNLSLQVFAAVTLASLLNVSNAFAESTEFKATLAGASEVPPVTSQASGEVTLSLEPELRIISWVAKFGDLSGPGNGGAFPRPGGCRRECAAHHHRTLGRFAQSKHRRRDAQPRAGRRS